MTRSGAGRTCTTDRPAGISGGKQCGNAGIQTSGRDPSHVALGRPACVASGPPAPETRMNPNRDPGGIRSTALIIRRKVARGWGPDRRRSGPHLFANSGNKFRPLQSLSGGVPVRRLFTRREGGGKARWLRPSYGAPFRFKSEIFQKWVDLVQERTIRIRFLNHRLSYLG